MLLTLVVSVHCSQAHQLPEGEEGIEKQNHNLEEANARRKKVRQRESVRCTSDLSLSYEISCDCHVLEEDGEVESAVALSICHSGVCSISHELDDHGEVALPDQ